MSVAASIPRPVSSSVGRPAALRIASGSGRKKVEQRDRVGHQATRDEADGFRGRGVQQVRVVDEQQQRTIFGGPAQQAQRSDPDREPLRCRTAAAVSGRFPARRATAGVDGPAIRGPAAEVGAGRRTRGRLRTRFPRPAAPAFHRLAHRVLQQRRLADPGLTRDDQHATLPHPRAGDQRRDPLLLGFTTDQH